MKATYKRRVKFYGKLEFILHNQNRFFYVSVTYSVYFNNADNVATKHWSPTDHEQR